MRKAISGYLGICKEEGIVKAMKSFYIYYYTKYKAEKRRKNKDFKVKIHDRIIEVNPNDNGLSTELLVFGSHEPDTTKFVSNYIKNEMICVDIGANIGYYSILYNKKVGKTGKVISIEPSPINFRFLRKNLENQQIKNFICLNVACGDIEGNVEFCLDSRANKCFVIDNNSQIPPNSKIISVPVKTVDNIIANEKLEKVDFIKIDVEGYELNTIQGSLNTIRKFKPTVQIEIHFPKIGLKKTREIFNFFKEENFEIIFYNKEIYNNFKKSKPSEKLNLSELIDYLPEHDPKISFKLILEDKKRKSN